MDLEWMGVADELAISRTPSLGQIAEPFYWVRLSGITKPSSRLSTNVDTMCRNCPLKLFPPRYLWLKTAPLQKVLLTQE